MSATPSVKFDALQAMYGAPFVYKEICLIYPATLADIAQVGIDEFYRMLQHITIHPPAINKLLADVTSLEFFLAQEYDDQFAKMTRKAISFFLREECLLMPDAEIFALAGAVGDSKFQTLTAEDFANIQDIIRQQHWLKPLKTSAEGVENKKAQEILNKLARGREQASQLKKGQGDGDASLIDFVGSMAIAVPGLNMLNIWDLTYYSFYDQFQRYQQKDSHDSNVRAALAGAKIPKDKLKGWIRPIEK